METLLHIHIASNVVMLYTDAERVTCAYREAPNRVAIVIIIVKVSPLCTCVTTSCIKSDEMLRECLKNNVLHGRPVCVKRTIES